MDKAVFDDDPKARLPGARAGHTFFWFIGLLPRNGNEIMLIYFIECKHILISSSFALYMFRIFLFCLFIFGQPMATVKCSFLIVTSEFR